MTVTLVSPHSEFQRMYTQNDPFGSVTFTVTQTSATLPYSPFPTLLYGIKPYTMSIATNSTTKTLPTGLSIDNTQSPPVITGTPSATFAAADFTFTITDAAGNILSDQGQQSTLNIAVNARTSGTPLSLTASYAVGDTLSSATFSSVSGGVSPYTYSYTGTLPSGISFDTSTGILSGTFDTVQSSSTVTFSVSDSNGVAATSTATRTFTVVAGTKSIVFRGGNTKGHLGVTKYTWTVPSGTTSISVVCVGGGGGVGGYTGTIGGGGPGGGGGGLVYLNNITVTPGTTYYIGAGWGGADAYTAGQSLAGGTGGSSYFGPTSDTVASTWLVAYGGAGGQFVGATANYTVGGGGGAAGYSGAGGAGGTPSTISFGRTAAGGASYAGATSAGYSPVGRYGGLGGGSYSGFASTSGATLPTGGGGGGGSGGAFVAASGTIAYGGGGVGLYGITSTDAGGFSTVAGGSTTSSQSATFVRNGGSGSVATGSSATSPYYGGGSSSGPFQGASGGGDYGGGGAGLNYGGGGPGGGDGGQGAVRIVWPGNTRQFPSTNVGTP